MCIYDDRLECLLGSTLVLTLPRGWPFQGRGAPNRTMHVVDYRHVIHTLRRKPGALLNLVHRDQLFPRNACRRTWDRLVAAQPSRAACWAMVGLLALAHERACEGGLAGKLNLLIEADAMPDLGVLEARFAPSPDRRPHVTVALPMPTLREALLLPNTAAKTCVAGALP